MTPGKTSKDGGRILCVGACLNDLLLRESDAFLTSLGREKGGMTMVEKAELDRAVKASPVRPSSSPGGSACNTAVGLARLGASSGFLGMRGGDEAGKRLEAQLEDWGVGCRLRRSPSPTGCVLSVITPDAQRTMLTFLGASAGMRPEDIAVEDFRGCGLVHLEGYLLFNRPLAFRVIALAKEAGAKVSLDLASFEVVRANMDMLPGLIEKSVDLLIANEDEARAYSGKTPEASLEEFARLSETAVVKLGKQGALIARGNERVHAPARLVKAVDTTGAGDLWAAGFLCGLLRGMPLESCARLASAMGAAVVSVVGAVVPEDAYAKIRREFSL